MTGFSRFTIAFLFACAAWPIAAANAQTRYNGWHSDLKSAAERAAKTGKPLFVVFRCER